MVFPAPCSQQDIKNSNEEMEQIWVLDIDKWGFFVDEGNDEEIGVVKIRWIGEEGKER